MGDYAPLRGIVNPADDYVICVDGGSHHLAGLGVRPDVIVGDLDSSEGPLPDVPVIKYKPEKDDTDTVLAVKHGLEQGMRDFLLLGGLKGRLDHTFANLCVLRLIVRSGAKGYIMDGDNEACYFENSSRTFKCRMGWYLSVFPFGGDAKGVYEKGLKYGLCDATLVAENPIGVSNEFLKGQDGTISVRDGALIIIMSHERK